MTRRRHIRQGGADGAPASGRLLGATQRRLLLLLCQGDRTVNELAAGLGVTDNAVRAQLQRLSRSGLVRQVGSRPGTRRPHAEYELTAEASKLFPTAYGPAVRSLVDVLTERLPAGKLREVLLESGRRLVHSRIGQLRARGPSRRLAELVERIGGSDCGVELLDRPDGTVVRACACPLAAVTGRHPETCGLVAGLLSELVEAPVREVCTKGDAPRCGFAVTVPS